MNLIAEKSSDIRWYTNLYPFVKEMGQTLDLYRWVFDAVETNVGLPDLSDSRDTWILSADEFRSLVAGQPQFIWAVVSAVDIDTKLIATGGDRPFADGNSDFWEGSPRPQIKGAAFEVVCWDSSATLLIGANEQVTAAFRRAYPGVKDLDQENKHRKKLG